MGARRRRGACGMRAARTHAHVLAARAVCPWLCGGVCVYVCVVAAGVCCCSRGACGREFSVRPRDALPSALSTLHAHHHAPLPPATSMADYYCSTYAPCCLLRLRRLLLC